MSKNKNEAINAIVSVLIEHYKQQPAVDELDIPESDVWTDENGKVTKIHVSFVQDENKDSVKIIPIEGFYVELDVWVEVIDTCSYMPGDNDPELAIHQLITYVAE